MSLSRARVVREISRVGCVTTLMRLAKARQLAGVSRAVRAMATVNTTPTTGLPPPNAGRFGTADVCDVHHPENVDVMTTRSVHVAAANYFKDFGGRRRFCGAVSTILCFENNPLVRAALEESGRGRVLVVDGGASARCALLGDNLAEMAAANGWAGIIINGMVRDSEDIAKMDIGVKAIGTHPLKSSKRDKGERDVPVSFANVTFNPGDFVYADGDGVVVASRELEL